MTFNLKQCFPFEWLFLNHPRFDDDDNCVFSLAVDVFHGLLSGAGNPVHLEHNEGPGSLFNASSQLHSL